MSASRSAVARRGSILNLKLSISIAISGHRPSVHFYSAQFNLAEPNIHRNTFRNDSKFPSRSYKHTTTTTKTIRLDHSPAGSSLAVPEPQLAAKSHRQPSIRRRRRRVAIKPIYNANLRIAAAAVDGLANLFSVAATPLLRSTRGT